MSVRGIVGGREKLDVGVRSICGAIDEITKIDQEVCISHCLSRISLRNSWRLLQHLQNAIPRIMSKSGAVPEPKVLSKETGWNCDNSKYGTEGRSNDAYRSEAD